ncbi:MAG TPA: hypothetical protein PLY52_12170, partial [Methanothrix sp.]|nr:hypothetical protein [Methanothrix sp.]
NPDGAVIMPSLIDPPACDEYMDKPKRITAKIEKLSGIDPRGTAKATFRGKIVLLGHIKQLDQSKTEYDTLILDSAEALLEARIGAFYRFSAGTTLNAMVQKLIDMANSLVPRGSFVQHSGHVYKWAGRGTTSHLGAINQLFQDDVLLTKASGIPSSPGTWYQSSTDLYLWTTDSKSPDYHPIFIPYFKDTMLRLGTLEGGDRTFPVCFEVGETDIFLTLKSLILAGGLEYQIRYGKDDLAYIDGKTIIGKGSETSPTTTYTEGENAEISVDIIDDLGEIQALIGQGAGNGITRQAAAAMGQTTAPGVWREAIFQAPGLYGAMLRTATEKAFQDYADPTIYNIRTIDQDWAQSVGNYVEIRRNRHMPIVRRIKHIQMKPDGSMLLEVGQRLRTIKELLRAGDEIHRKLSSFYGTHNKNAWSWGIDSQNIDSVTPLTISFDLKSSEENGEIDPNFPYQVLLSVRLDWYKSSVKSATVSGLPHGSVGNHTGYGGGETSDEEMTAHSVPGTTSMQTAALVLLAGAWHTHSFTGYNDTFVGEFAGTAWGETIELNPDFFEGECFGDCYVNAYIRGGDTGVENDPYPAAIPDQHHVHGIPSRYTQAAGYQSHTESIESAKTRAGSAQHADQTLDDATEKMEFLVNQLSTGSPALLVLSIKCNGVHVPGSPFDGGTGLYVGDRLDNIDISSLVGIGSTNTLVFELSEYGGAALVRCALAGNINVSAIISAF